MDLCFGGHYRAKRVFLTGHTGFKGAWLSEWLVQLGARVTGYSLPPPTKPALFDQLGLASRIERHLIADIRNQAHLTEALLASQPDFVFHLAAQPLVRESYRAPVETYAINVTGTLHLLEALRRLDRPCAAVFVTTDKCYENREIAYSYREDDPLGGHDPYSSSKAAMEIALGSWRRSFFCHHPVRIASARAGNVVGGGDWAADRIVPDSIRALQAGEPIAVRNPGAVRPWQHVLEPLSGYLRLAARLANDPTLATAFNFGPNIDCDRTVREVVEAILRHWPGTWSDASDSQAPHEANLLHLNIQKARTMLSWSPVWTFDDTVRETVLWYRQSFAAPDFVPAITRGQIHSYVARGRELRASWTNS